MLSGSSLQGSGAILVQQYIGTAYDIVKGVYDELDAVKHVSANMEAVHTVYAQSEVMAAFVDNPDFLTFLTDNMDDLNTFSGDLATLMLDYARLDGAPTFTNGVILGTGAPQIQNDLLTGITGAIGSTVQVAHGLALSDCLDFKVLVECSDNTLREPHPDEIRVYLTATDLVLETLIEATIFGGRPFRCFITKTPL